MIQKTITMKRNFIIPLLALVVGICVEAQVLTFDNPGDKLSPYKESLFDPQTKEPYFDEVYISQNKSAYYTLYQNTWDNIVKNLRDASANPGVWTYIDANGNETTLPAYTGRNVLYMNGESEWSIYDTGKDEATKKKVYLNDTTEARTKEALHYYEPTEDGFLVTNKQHTKGTFYYGYYKINRTRYYTYKRTRNATVRRTISTSDNRQTKVENEQTGTANGDCRRKIFGICVEYEKIPVYEDVTYYNYTSNYSIKYQCATGNKRVIYSDSSTKSTGWKKTDINTNTNPYSLNSHNCSINKDDFNYTTTRTAYSSSYTYELIQGADNGSSRLEANVKPANNIDNTDTQAAFENWSYNLAWNSWDCDDSNEQEWFQDVCNQSRTLNAVTTSWNMTQSCTKSYTLNDYFYVWARLIIDENNNVHLDYIDENGNPITINITDAQANAAINNPQTPLFNTNITDGVYNRYIDDITQDTVAQVRHIYTVFSKRGIGTGLFKNSDPENINFYDFTWYDTSYSPNGQRYTTLYAQGTNTNPPAAYHQWDKQYFEGGASGHGTGVPVRIENKETVLEKTATDAVEGEKDQAYFFEKTADNKGYTFTRMFPFKDERLGNKTDKSIYFTGNFEQLKQSIFSSESGWSRLYNCDIYLEDVYLVSAANSAAPRIDAINYNLDTDGVKTYNCQAVASAASFLLPSGESRFHLKGDNQMLGAYGGKLNIHFTATTENTNFRRYVRDGKFVDTYNLDYQRYCSPIEIMDGATANVVIDAFWPNNENTYGSLDISGKDDRVAPFYTGGENGTFTINGGYINVVPANYHSEPKNFYYKKDFLLDNVSDVIRRMLILMYGRDSEYPDQPKRGTINETYNNKYAEWSNYLVCGSSFLNSSLYGKAGTDHPTSGWKFGGSLHTNETILGIIEYFAGSNYVDDYLPQIDSIGIMIDGLGGGVPKGRLIINGGTITMVGNDQNQPLLAPNVQINGGNIVNPIYSVTTHNHKNGYNLAVPVNKRLDAVNKFGESLQRWEYHFPQKLADYSEWHIDSVWRRAEDEYPQALCINYNTEKQYYYGLTNVLSGEQKEAYLYVTQDDHQPHWEWHKNYVISAGETVEGLGGDGVDNLYRPVYFTFYHGGAFNEYDDFTVIAKARHKRKYMDNAYYPICMPYKVNKIWDTDDGESVQLTSFVSPTVNPEADNSMAYCYLYFLDENRTDNIIDNTTHGVEDVFRQGYTTHADGRYILANQPYIFKMINNSNKPYWNQHYVVLESETGATINGSNHFVSAPRPTIGPKDVESPDELPFVMGGNPTFAYKEFGEPFFRVQPEWNGDSNWWKEMSGDLSFLPCESFLLGSLETTKVMRNISLDAFYEAKRQEVATAIQNDNNNKDFSVVGANGYITVITNNSSNIQIYTPAGKLVTETQLSGSSYKVINLPQGVYLVRNEQQIEKVLVK